jgi:hypothetical protein
MSDEAFDIVGTPPAARPRRPVSLLPRLVRFLLTRLHAVFVDLVHHEAFL